MHGYFSGHGNSVISLNSQESCQKAEDNASLIYKGTRMGVYIENKLNAIPF